MCTLVYRFNGFMEFNGTYNNASENVYTFKSKILILKEYVDKMSTHNVVMLFSSYQCTLFIFLINMMGIFICIADSDLLLSKSSV